MRYFSILMSLSIMIILKCALNILINGQVQNIYYSNTEYTFLLILSFRSLSKSSKFEFFGPRKRGAHFRFPMPKCSWRNAKQKILALHLAGVTDSVAPFLPWK